MIVPTLFAGVVISGSAAGLILWLVGLIIAVCIVLFIMRQLDAPAIAYKVLYVVIAVIALLLVIDLFFGSRSTVIVGN